MENRRKSSRPEFRFGEGKISGYLSVLTGGLSLGTVLCLHFPAQLTTPEFRELYHLPLIRALLALFIFSSFILGLVSYILDWERNRRTSGKIGMVFASLAALLGGASISIPPVAGKSYIGLDWFLLDLLLVSLVFVPVERGFRRIKEQHIFRVGWKTDLAHFFFGHVLIQYMALVVSMPALLMFRWLGSGSLQNAVASQPGWLQFIEIVFVADLAQYWIHRLFHEVSFLWPFHAIHHSSQEMDWLVGSRQHPVDMIVSRAVIYLPLFFLGFDQTIVRMYLVFVSFHATFDHANIRLRLGKLKWILASPEYHHWHHSAEKQAINKNYAVHLPLYDVIFGTAYLSNRWPERYGIEGDPVPPHYVRQMVWPFRKAISE